LTRAVPTTEVARGCEDDVWRCMTGVADFIIERGGLGEERGRRA